MVKQAWWVAPVLSILDNRSITLTKGIIHLCGDGLHVSCSHLKGTTALRAFLSSHRLKAGGYPERVSMKSMTTLGLNERLERVLAYAVGWLSGLLLFIFEKNRSVRWHAVQSMITFGAMSLLMLIVSVLRGFLHMIPLLNLLTDAGLGLLLSIFWWVTVGLWLWLMIMAWFKPDYRLPVVSELVRYWV